MTSIIKDFSPQKIPARISTTLLCGLFVTDLYVTRIVLSIAIVSMVQTVSMDVMHSDVKRESFCLRNLSNDTDQYLNDVITNSTGGKTENSDLPPLQMTTTERGNLLSAFFYVYVFTGILGGRLAEIFGAKRICGVVLLVDALSNFLTPFISQSGYWLFFSLRCITGFFQGMSYPAFTFLLSQWMPPDEFTRSIAFVFHASSLGSSISMVFFGYIISLLGWECAFYISGSYSLLCLTIWIFFLFDTPEEHPRISLQEKRYITQSMKERKSKKPDYVPWRKILQSLPIWASNVAGAASISGFNLLVTQLPIYMSSIIGVNIRKNGFLSSLPLLARFLGSNTSTWLLHFIKQKYHWQTKTLRKIATSLALLGAGVSYILVGYVGCGHLSTIFLFSLGAAFSGFSTSGYLCSPFDLTSNFSGTVMGIINSFSFVISMMVPVVTGALTPEETISEWRTVFWLFFANYIGTTLFYNTFLSAEIQSWDHINEQTDENTDEVEVRLTDSDLKEPLDSSMTKTV